MKELITIYDNFTKFIDKHEFIEEDLELMIRILDLINSLILREVRKKFK